jgi:hypothetical protein
LIVEEIVIPIDKKKTGPVISSGISRAAFILKMAPVITVIQNIITSSIFGVIFIYLKEN